MHALDTLQTDLQRLRDGESSVQAFSTAARAHQELLARLPERYGLVLTDLLDRLESSALFSEESCSFSQSSLFDHLQAWIDKARAQITRG